MDKFFDAVAGERQSQLRRWGDTDSQNTVYHWNAYITAYASRSLTGAPGPTNEQKATFKQDMIKVAALALAAYQNL
jgi:hypothetical protein